MNNLIQFLALTGLIIKAIFQRFLNSARCLVKIGTLLRSECSSDMVMAGEFDNTKFLNRKNAKKTQLVSLRLSVFAVYNKKVYRRLEGMRIEPGSDSLNFEAYAIGWTAGFLDFVGR